MLLLGSLISYYGMDKNKNVRYIILCRNKKKMKGTEEEKKKKERN